MRIPVHHLPSGVTGQTVPGLVGVARDPNEENVSIQETLTVMIAWKDWKCPRAVMNRCVQPSLPGLTGQNAQKHVEEGSGKR